MPIIKRNQAKDVMREKRTEQQTRTMFGIFIFQFAWPKLSFWIHMAFNICNIVNFDSAEYMYTTNTDTKSALIDFL